VAVIGGQRDELVEARADAILAGEQTATAYAEHFEGPDGPRPGAQAAVLRAADVPPTGVLLAVILVTRGLLGYAAATVRLAPVVPAGQPPTPGYLTPGSQAMAIQPIRQPITQRAHSSVATSSDRVIHG
jgi:hypothetical protein